MNARLLALLFGIPLFGAVPMLIAYPSGAASAGLAGGFVLPIENAYHVAVLLVIGLVSAWFAQEALFLLPLCALLMLTIGFLMEISTHSFHAVHAFVIGAILLFSFSVSMLRNRSCLLFIPPIAIWAYYAGGGYISYIPTLTTPLFFLIGITISCTLLLAIGITLGITFADSLRDSLDKFRSSAVCAMLFSLF